MLIKSVRFVLLRKQQFLTCESSSWPSVLLLQQSSVLNWRLDECNNEDKFKKSVDILLLSKGWWLLRVTFWKILEDFKSVYLTQQLSRWLSVIFSSFLLISRSDATWEAVGFVWLFPLSSASLSSIQGLHTPPCRAGSARGSLAGYQTGFDLSWYSTILLSSCRTVWRLLSAILWYSHGSVVKWNQTQSGKNFK